MRDLVPLFDPASVAVVGASSDPRKWGHWIAVRALRGEHRRAVSLVNRSGERVLGRAVHRSLREVQGGVELVVVAVPEHALEATVDDALGAGACAIIAITAGTTASADRDAELAARVRSAGAVLVGPNCLGIFDAAAELELAAGDFAPGSVALLSQSGNLALEIALLAPEAGIGFSRFVSLGNQADLTAADLLRDLAGHEPTRAVALYLEDFADGRAFARAAAALTAAGKPVVLLTLERSAATARAARSHTGALATDAAVIDAVCAASGIERVRTPGELVDVAAGLLDAPPCGGRRIAVVTDGGGHGAIAASLCEAAGLVVPEFGPETRTAVEAELPAVATCTNPVDLAGGAERDIEVFERLAEILLEGEEVDAVLMTGYFGGYGEYGPESSDAEAAVGTRLAEIVRRRERPLVVQTMYPSAGAVGALRRGGVPVFGAIERAVGVLARIAARGERELSPLPAVPATAWPVPACGSSTDARELLAAAGIEFVDRRTADSTREALAAANALGFPVAVKATGLLHKSDAGGVALGLRDPDEVRAAVARMPSATVTVERMAPVGDGVELIVGARWDPRFGPIALAGIGGIYAEILDDITIALAPVDTSGALGMLARLRGYPLLAGARGRPPLHLDAAARAICALSACAAEHPEIAELEVNPLLVLAEGAVALDARLIPAARKEPDGVHALR